MTSGSSRDAGASSPQNVLAPIVISENGSWALLRIDRVEKRNALNQAARLTMIEAFARLAKRTRVVVITGTDKYFCAGADFKERARRIAEGHPDTAGAEGIQLANAIREFPGVVIAAVNGLALGYGFNLVNCADIAVAADSAKLGLPELRSGGFASMSAATTQLVGISRKRLGWLVYGAEPIDAVTAEAWGLVNHVVPLSDLPVYTAELAQRISAFDAAALVETKAALSRVPDAANWKASMEMGQDVAGRIRKRQASKADIA